MKLFDRLDRYFVDNEYRITISNEGINIINYIEIVDFSSTRIVVRYRDGFTVFNGSDLVVAKMLDDELLIKGKLKSVEYN